MAINVDTVYKTVLLILNKEQRGIMTPDEFNKIATQVQLEIFEEYFDDLNQQLRVADNDNEYADRQKNLDEKIAVFKTINDCNLISTGKWELPTSSGSTVYTEPVITTIQGQNTYTLSVINQSQIQQGTVKVYFNGILQAASAYNIFGNTIVLTTIPGATSFSILITVTANDFYRLGTVIYKGETEVERIMRNDLLYVNRSPLTKPTVKYPLYVYEENVIYVYPTSINDDISATYVRKPKDVIWNFTATAPNYNYIYSPNNSQQFELMPSEQINVITRILLYAGVVIKDPSIVQTAAAIVQNEKMNSKS
jgi:hypothetical protein